MKQSKVAFVIPYIGTFRKDFPLFLNSCKENPSVDFLFFCDNTEQYELKNWGGNIHVYYSTLQDFKRRAQRLFDNIQVSLETPYKLCDFRPLYGMMFAEELAGYDYWGHCDTDVILGDIRKMLDKPISEGYLKIQLHGHLSLYHNDAYTNNVFREHHPEPHNGFPGIVTYEEVLTSPHSYAFDEGNGVGLTWLRYHKKDFFVDYSLFSNPNRMIKSFSSNQDGILNVTRRYYEYDNGTLIEHTIGKDGCDSTKELLYVHFYQRTISVCVKDYSHYIVVPNKAIPYQKLFWLDRWLWCFKPLYLEFWTKLIKKKLL